MADQPRRIFRCYHTVVDDDVCGATLAGMWKRGYFWAGIIGFLLVVIYALSAYMQQPTHMVAVNVAIYGQDALLVGLGIFLIIIFLLGRQKQDAGQIPERFEPDSPEDIRSIYRKQYLVLAFFFLYEFVFSFQSWAVNDYSAGATWINAIMIFDIVWNIILLLLVVGVFLNKRNFFKPFAYTFIAGTLVEAAMSAALPDWNGVVSNILLAVFLVCATVIPLNRIRFRIINLILLPVVLILTAVAGIIAAIPLNQLNQNEGLLWQEYQQDISNVSSAYSVFIQSSAPTSIDIVNVQTTTAQMDKDAPQLISALDALQTLYQKQLPSVSQRENLKEIQLALQTINVDEQESKVAEELMSYCQDLNFNDLSAAQKSQISSLEQQQNSLNQQSNELNYQSNNL